MANLSSALLLFSGYLTLGVTTVGAVMFVATYIGATFHAAADGLGTVAVLRAIVFYAPFEFSGLFLAAVAGLLPTVALALRLVRRAPTHPGTGEVRARPTRVALRTLALATACILLGGAVETLVIIVAEPLSPGGT